MSFNHYILVQSMNGKCKIKPALLYVEIFEVIQKKGVLFAVLLLVVLLPMSQFPDSRIDTSMIPRHGIISILADHDTIVINNDTDFVNQATLESWPGNGTIGNPYLIQNYNFSTGGVAITIKDTSVHFIIQYCTLFSPDTCIYLSNVKNGTVYHCNSNSAIMFYKGSRNSVTSNTIHRTSSPGISIFEANDIEITQNTIECLYTGIELDRAINITITFNEIDGGGISVDGNSIEFLNSHTIHDNLVDGQPVLYLNGLSEASFDVSLYSQVIVVDCEGCSLHSGLFIDSYFYAITISFSQDIEVYDCNVSQIHSAFMYVYKSSGCSFINNSINGVIVPYDFDECQSCIIQGNIIDGGFHTFKLDNVRDFIFEGNSLYNSEVFFWSRNVNGTIIHDNLLDGWNTDFGIELIRGYSNYIYGNKIKQCQEGISIEEGAHNIFINNKVFDSGQFGIHLQASTYNNTFVNNTLARSDLSNALDEGAGNHWDDSIAFGNIWDSYDGFGSYSIPGAAGAIDHFPRTYEPATTSSISTSTTTNSLPTISTTTTQSTSTPATSPIEFPDLTGLLLIVGVVGIISVVVIIVIINLRKRT